MSSQYAPSYVLVARDWVTVLSLTAIGFVATLVGGVALFVVSPEGFQILPLALGSGLGTLATAVAFMAWTGNLGEYVDFPGFSATALGIGVLAGIALVLVQGALTYAFALLEVGEPFGAVSQTVAGRGVPVLVGMVLVNLLVTAPAEELLFRNAIQKKLADSQPVAVAVLGASCLFTLVHVPDLLVEGGGAPVTGSVEILLNGLVYGGLYARFGRIDVPIVAHGLYNGAVFVLAYLL